MKQTSIWLIIATILVVSGTVTFIIALSMNNWDFKRFNTTKYVTNTYEINDDFNDLLLHTTEADIIFLPSDDNICKVICYEAETAKHNVTVKDNALTINVNDQRKWYNYIGISLSSPSITVYLPKSEYNSLRVKTSTGKTDIPSDFNFDNADIYCTTGAVNLLSPVANNIKIQTTTGAIRVKNITTDNLELSTTTGSISVDSVKCTNDIKIKVTTGSTTVKNTHCNNFSSDGDTGIISLDNLISDGNFHIERSTGDVKFKQCDASKILVKTSTGNVSGSLLSEKAFVTKTSTGTIKVPETTTGGKCEITTSTGNIKIELP